MTYTFDTIIDRRGTDSEKWGKYGDGVLPMWVADMDFRSPEPVVQALRARVEHGVFDYGDADAELRAVVQARSGRSMRPSWVCPIAIGWPSPTFVQDKCVF